MMNVEDAEIVGLPKLEKCVLLSAFKQLDTLKLEDAGIMKEMKVVRRMLEDNGDDMEFTPAGKSVVISSVEELEHANNSVSKIEIASNSCNIHGFKVLDLSRFKNLKELKVGDNCFENVNEVKLIGLKKLERVVIGENSFTKLKSDWPTSGKDDCHFYLKDCGKLKELKIGRFSFNEYTGCEIENVPSLEVIEIGDLERDSYNFKYADLELRGVSFSCN